MLALSRYGLSRGVELKINWPGRLGVAPTMGAPVLCDGRCPLAGARDALRRDGACAHGHRALSFGMGRATGQARGRRAQTLKLSLTLRPAGVYSPPRQYRLRQDEGVSLRMDTFPDLGSLTDQELKDLIKQLTDEEMEISYRRRILHGKIDILRAELVNRLRKKDESGELVISGADVQQLTDILAGRVPPTDATNSGHRSTRWPSTAPSADSPTPTAPTTASAAARSSPGRSRPPGRNTATLPRRRDRRDRGGRVERRGRAWRSAGDPRRAAAGPARASRWSGTA